MKDPLVSSLQKILISAHSQDKCGLFLWCGFGTIISSSSQSLLSTFNQRLVYLTLAEMTGAGGKIMVDLISLHNNKICDEMLDGLNVLSCIS